MKKMTLVSALLLASAYSTQAFGLYLYNRSGGTLCVAVTRDSPNDLGASVVTEGWQCFGDNTDLTIEVEPGSMDFAIKEEDGSDYVADYHLTYDITKSWVPKDNHLTDYGVEILKFNDNTGYAYSIVRGEGDWLPFSRASDLEDLAILLDAKGFKQFDAWRLPENLTGSGIMLN